MKQQFNFETNIEKRMPDTGKVFMVDRMTSDYALSHPFNVDEYIESVYQKYELIAQEDAHARAMGWNKSHEELRNMWTAVLSDNNPRGNASLYPNQNGPQPALMEVWHKAGDYWRRGLHIDDLLPAIVPATKITRLDGGEWIALFPKDMMLLDEPLTGTNPLCDKTDNIEPAGNQCSTTPSEQNHAPVELDLFSQMQADIDQLRQENQELKDKQCNMIQEQAAVCSPTDVLDTEDRSCATQGRPSPTPRPRRVRRQAQDVMQLYGSPAITVSHDDDDHSQRNKKIFAAVATAVVFLVLVNTVGLFGIAALGLLAGGLVK